MFFKRAMAAVCVLGAVAVAAGPANALTLTPSAGYTTSFSYASDPGGWIGGTVESVGQGGSATYTPGQSNGLTTTATMTTYQGFIWADFAQYAADGSLVHDWNIELAAPAGQKFAVGTYTNVQRAPFQTGGAAGLSVFGDGRGCNQVFGSFTINSMTTDRRQLEYHSLDVTYEQHCESPDAPALRGELKWND